MFLCKREFTGLNATQMKVHQLKAGLSLDRQCKYDSAEKGEHALSRLRETATREDEEKGKERERRRRERTRKREEGAEKRQKNRQDEKDNEEPRKKSREGRRRRK